MAEKAKSILSYSKQAPKLGYRLVTPLQQPIATRTKTPILPIMGGVNINVPNPIMPSQQRTPINLPMADRLINRPAPIAPVKDKSENKKPLEWGFKGRKKTDILNEDSNDFTNVYREWNKLSKVAKEKPNTSLGIWLNNRIYDVENASPTTDIIVKKDIINRINGEFIGLENEGVPRELTGKMFGNKLSMWYLNKNRININSTYDDKIRNAVLENKGKKEIMEIIKQKNNEYDTLVKEWKKGWLRYYNELDKSQKETFDSLSEEWYGSPNELVDTVKSL